MPMLIDSKINCLCRWLYIFVCILHVTDLCASVGDHSSLKVDFLQNERLDVSAIDGNCLFNNIEVHTHTVHARCLNFKKQFKFKNDVLTSGLTIQREVIKIF